MLGLVLPPTTPESVQNVDCYSMNGILSLYYRIKLYMQNVDYHMEMDMDMDFLVDKGARPWSPMSHDVLDQE